MNTPRLSSVAAKLAGTTIVLIALATLGIYLRLSEYQRESLLRAKELSAIAVTRLSADSCAAAVVFEDQTEIQETLRTLGRNEEIEYASVWQVDEAARVKRRIAELQRGRSEVVTAVPRAIELRRDPDRVSLVAPIVDLNGKVVGVLTTAFSLARENAAIARLKRTALLISTAIATGLMLLLMAMARVVVVGPLAKLVGAAKQLGEGRGAKIDVSSNDEVGQLAQALRTMAGAIQVREERINARNRDMRLVLDNVGQGFITLDASGAMSDERSRIVDDWFGPVEGTPKLWDYLRPFDANFADNFELGWSAVVDQFLPVELCLDQLPRTVKKDGRTLELNYRPIFHAVSRPGEQTDQLHKTVVVITDITVRLARERSEQRQRETMSIHRRLLADRPAFEQFFAEASALVSALAQPIHGDLVVIRRQIHTLKGNCALFGIESVAQLCHEIEDRIEDSAVLDPADRTRLREAWAAIVETHDALTEGGGGDSIRVDRQDYEKLLVDVRAIGASPLLVAEIEAWQSEPAVKRFALLREQIERLASRLGRADVDVVWQPTDLRLPPRKWAPFWSAFAHVIRNTVDHGVETTAARLAAGKSPRATIHLCIAQEGDQVVVSITDDGPGIDWAALAAKLRERGLPCSSRHELETALLAGGLSSRSESSATSGRGLGLSAVQQSLRELGGRLELIAEPGGGTSLRCWLPTSMLAIDRLGGIASESARDAAPSEPQIGVSLGAASEGGREIRPAFRD
jgi:two-component system chemotaxis sensor kinase CheA